MNIGYEYDTFTFGGSFLLIENIYSIQIEQLAASYNVLQSSAFNFLIFIKNYNGTVVIKDSKFEIMLLDNLIIIDSSDVEQYTNINIGPDKESISHSYAHLEMKNLTFEYIYTSYYFIKYVSGMVQNINVEEIAISYASSKASFIYLQCLYYDFYPLGIKKLPNGLEYTIIKLFVNLSQISISSSSTHDNVVGLSLLPYSHISGMNIYKITSYSDKIYAEDIYYDFFVVKGYFSKLFTELTNKAYYCKAFISANYTIDLNLNGIYINDSFCNLGKGFKGIYIKDSRQLNIDDIHIKNVVISGENYGIITCDKVSNFYLSFTAIGYFFLLIIWKL